MRTVPSAKSCANQASLPHPGLGFGQACPNPNPFPRICVQPLAPPSPAHTLATHDATISIHAPMMSVLTPKPIPCMPTLHIFRLTVSSGVGGRGSPGRSSSGVARSAPGVRRPAGTRNPGTTVRAETAAGRGAAAQAGATERESSIMAEGVVGGSAGRGQSGSVDGKKGGLRVELASGALQGPLALGPTRCEAL